MANELLGSVKIYIDLTVSVEDMKEWEPERITAFFSGIAMARRAAAGDDPDVLTGTKQLNAAPDNVVEGNFKAINE